MSMESASALKPESKLEIPDLPEAPTAEEEALKEALDDLLKKINRKTFIKETLVPALRANPSFEYNLQITDQSLANGFLKKIKEVFDAKSPGEVEFSIITNEDGTMSFKAKKIVEGKNGELDPVVDETEAVPGADVSEGENEAFKDFDFDAFIVNDLLPKFEGDTAYVYDLETQDKEVAQTFIAGVQNKLNQNTGNTIHVSLISDANGFSMKVEKLSTEPTLENTKKNSTYDFDNDPEYIQFLKKEASDRDIEDIIDLRNPPKHLPDGTTFSMFIADVQKRYIQKNPEVEAQMRNVEREQIVTERKTEAMKDIELAIKDELYYQDAGVDDTLNKGIQRKQKLAESYISAGLITQEEVDLLEKNIAYEKSILTSKFNCV